MKVEPISATTLSHYIRLERCERYLRFRLDKTAMRMLKARFRDLDVIEQPLTPLLREAGQHFESSVTEQFVGAYDLAGQPAAATVKTITALADGESCYLVQSELQGIVGGYVCLGRADIARVSRRHDGVALLIADIKASQRDRVEHRLQVAFYLRLLTTMLAERGIAVVQCAGAILKQTTDGTLPNLDDPANQFDVKPYDLVLSQLLEGPEADVARVAALPFDDVPYSLGYKCDSCMFNQLCMVDSANRQDIALVPMIQPAEIRALRAAGVGTLRALSMLKELPDPTAWNVAFASVVGQEDVVATLSATPTVGPKLDRLVQRARAVLKRFDGNVTAYAHLLDGTFSQFPADDVNPDLVKIFLDAQHDYVQDRLYLVSARVQGPRGVLLPIRMTERPPTTEDEAGIVTGLVQDILAAIPHVARTPDTAPIHLYVYDSYDQKIWLDALERHLPTLTTIPAFYDLLTASPALSQGMLSTLVAEVRDRRNLGITCQNLYSVAASFGFNWRTPQDNFRSTFYLRVFDAEKQRRDGVWIERASRYSSDIPLEYAYGAWGRLPDDEANWHLVAAYARCSPEVIQRFQLHRLLALSHIEAALGAKNRQIVKEPVSLALLGQQATPPSGLARALEEFLAMEHHAALQERLTRYALPITRRVQTGRALHLECTAVHLSGRDVSAHFQLDYNSIGLDGAVVQEVPRLKDGDWTVLNPADDRSPWKVLHGRIATIQAIDGDRIELRLLSITSYHSRFKYSHDTTLLPTPGARYMLDEMADDLNFDKQLEAVRHAPHNVFFARIIAGTFPDSDPIITRRGEQFLRRVRTLAAPLRLTAAQEAIIGGHGATPLLCVQGPPGSGKTATLGWAALERLFARDERPLRIAVCARTHKATALVLESIAKRARQLAQTQEGRALGRVAIYKLVAAPGEALPDPDIRPIDTAADWGAMTAAFEAPLAVIGGTPGKVYTLIKQRSGGTIDWTAKLFDLVIIDEASQMSLPEAVLAGAFLKPDGQMIVVGDHRQMPPILAHGWKKERTRAATAHAPYRSVFEYLLERGCPSVRLDESFRLHRVHAAFLATHIYQRDGIAFHSRQERVLAALPPTDDSYVTAALRSDYPTVIIEHTEAESQQHNRLEEELAVPLITAAEALGLNGADGIGIVVPHRAQKAALRRRFPALAAADAIDTVERFQGGERDVIIVSATASDPSYVLAEAGFLLNLNRLNVAISRPRRKLIVIASSTIFRLLTDDLDLFEHALLWKHLRYDPALIQLWQGRRAERLVRIFGRHCGHTVALEPPMTSLPELNAARTRRERKKEAW